MISEMIASQAMIRRNHRTMKMATNCAEEYPMAIQLAGCEIVEEKERLSTQGKDVVYGHRDEIDTNRVVPPDAICDQQFGAHAISPAHKNRFLILAELEEAAEAPKASDDFRAPCAGDRGLNSTHDLVSGIDVDTSLRVRATICALRHSCLRQICRIARLHGGTK